MLPPCHLCVLLRGRLSFLRLHTVPGLAQAVGKVGEIGMAEPCYIHFAVLLLATPLASQFPGQVETRKYHDISYALRPY